jgi:hypothetical protein
MYHPNNNQDNEIAGEAGVGWALAKGGIITRELAGELDESYYNESSSFYKKMNLMMCITITFLQELPVSSVL